MALRNSITASRPLDAFLYQVAARLSFAGNKRDLIMHLYDGMMMSAQTDKPGQLSRIYYKQDRLKVRDVANSINITDADTAANRLSAVFVLPHPRTTGIAVCSREPIPISRRAKKRPFRFGLQAALLHDSWA